MTILRAIWYGYANPSGCAVKDVVMRPLAGWNCELEPHRGNVCMSDVSVVCCQAEVSASG